MKKEIKIIDKDKQVMRVTTVDERWYAKPGEDTSTGLPTFKFYPSSTWIAGYYPKGIGFYKWLAERGWDEAEAIKVAAGDKGSKVHQAIEIIEQNGSLPIDTKIMNHRTEQEEDLTTAELDCILSFTKWHNETKPVLLATEMTVFGNNYAGTLDRIYRINDQIFIVDFKTSAQVWEEHKLQISSYSNADIDYKTMEITDQEWTNRKMAILQVGYKLNKAGYKFTEVEDKFNLFQMSYAIWENENNNSKPKEKDYPLVLKLNSGEIK